MVYLTTPLLTAIAVLSAVTSAAPHQRKRDSSINEPAFSAPNGVIQSSAASSTPVVAGASSNSNNYGSSGSNSWNYGSSGNSYNSGSGNNWNQGSNNWSQGSNNWNQGSNNWNQGANNWNQGSNNWNQGSNNLGSSSSDTWTSTSSAANSWQTSSSDNSGQTTTSSANNSWQTSSSDSSGQTTTSSANNSWQTSSSDTLSQETSQTTLVATTTVESQATATSWNGNSGSYNSGSSSWNSGSSSYGSGSQNWGSDYNNCVSQCQAQWGLPPPSTTQPPSYNGNSGSSGNSGSWNSGGTPTTHTVVVAPTKGVLRYIPFAINASVGDTISWQWHAGPHTVTKSSAATPCNKTLDNPFASGSQNQSFVFNQLINDTNPVFYYCGVPGHCEKGMFGIVNAPSTLSLDTNLESQILAQAAANPMMGAMVAMVQNMTMGTSAYTWGNQFDTSSVPPQQMQSFIENTLYTRLFYAMNNGSLESGMGAFSPSGSLVWPDDLSVLMAAASANGTDTSGSSMTMSMPAGSSPTSGAQSGAYGAMTTSGASHRMASSGGLLAAAAVVVGALLI